jgi:hypothetical protein
MKAVAIKARQFVSLLLLLSYFWNCEPVSDESSTTQQLMGVGSDTNE